MNSPYAILYFQFSYYFNEQRYFAEAKRQETMASDGDFTIDYEIFYHHNAIIQKYGAKELVLLDKGGFSFTRNSQANDFIGSVSTGLREELKSRGFGNELHFTN